MIALRQTGHCGVPHFAGLIISVVHVIRGFILATVVGVDGTKSVGRACRDYQYCRGFCCPEVGLL